MRFHQSVGIVQHINGNNGDQNIANSLDNANINQSYFNHTVQLDQLKNVFNEQNYKDDKTITSNLNRNNLIINDLQYKADSAYFKSFLENHCYSSNNGNDHKTTLTEENLTKVMVKHPKNCCN